MQTDEHTYTHMHTHIHTCHSSLLFSVDCDFHAGHRGKGQRLDMRKEGEAPLCHQWNEI